LRIFLKRLNELGQVGAVQEAIIVEKEQQARLGIARANVPRVRDAYIVS
jgi:hypothetical protein